MDPRTELAGVATDIKRNWLSWTVGAVFYPARALARAFVWARQRWRASSRDAGAK